MKLVSIKKLCNIYDITKEDVRKSIKSKTFDYVIEKRGEVKIDLDSFKQSEYHINFMFDKLGKINGRNIEYSYKLDCLYNSMDNNHISDEIFKSYYKLYVKTQSEYIMNIISKLEKDSFSKSDYEDYLKSLKNKYKENLNYDGGDTDRISMNIIKLIIPLVSDEFIEKYPSYYDENFLLSIIDDIENHKYLNNKEMEVMNIYTQLLKFKTDKGLLPISGKIDFDEYENRLNYMKSHNRIYKRIFSDGDDKFFSHIRDMFIF